MRRDPQSATNVTTATAVVLTIVKAAVVIAIPTIPNHRKATLLLSPHSVSDSESEADCVGPIRTASPSRETSKSPSPFPDPAPLLSRASLPPSAPSGPVFNMPESVANDKNDSPISTNTNTTSTTSIPQPSTHSYKEERHTEEHPTKKMPTVIIRNPLANSFANTAPASTSRLPNTQSNITPTQASNDKTDKTGSSSSRSASVTSSTTLPPPTNITTQSASPAAAATQPTLSRQAGTSSRATLPKRARGATTPEQSEPRPTSQAESATAASIGAPSRMSQGSLPFSALVSPHAPSVTYHMRDPRKPPRVQPTLSRA
ncbi:hypothetical protein B0H13DRAFT_2313476 [Mycena leptocephala]|nr:hypothetical protein B0H13DRAFT_2313476 [Mycena leptocephala]